MYVALVTARAGSERLVNKNILPISGIPLALKSVSDGINAGLPTILSTDIESIKEPARRMGAIVVDRPEELSTANCSHGDTIKHAVETAGFEDHHVVLLQPTSPFRLNGVVSKCVDTHKLNPQGAVATVRKAYNWFIESGKRGFGEQIFGCVFVFPAGGSYEMYDQDDITGVETHPLNCMEIDTEQDYIDSVKLACQTKEIGCPVRPDYLLSCIKFLNKHGIIGDCTLVARPDGHPIPQDNPVVYINHCWGYDGGRVDAVMLVANTNIIKEENINEEMVRCIEKCKCAIIRDHKSLDGLLKKFPSLKSKSFVLESIHDSTIDSITTGVVMQSIMAYAGCEVTRVGFSKLVDRANKIGDNFNNQHYLGIQYDTAILNTYGADR